MLLEVLLGQVLEISLGEGDLGLNDKGVSVLGDGDVLSEVSSLSVNLDVLGEVGFEVSKNENVVFNGILAVDGELVAWLLCLETFLNLLDHL